MKYCRTYKKYFVEALYNELQPEKRQNLQHHLGQCETCRQEFADMRATLRVLGQRERPEPEPQFWNAFYARVSQRMQSEHRAGVPLWKKLEKLLAAPPAWTYRLAGAAAMLILGIWIGYLYFGRPSERFTTVSQPHEYTPAMAQTRQQASEYLESSKILLLGLVNIEGSESVNLADQQEISRQLLNKSVALKDRLKGSKHERLLSLIADLEIIMLQIANIEKEISSPAIELITSGIDEQGILLKINLEEMILSENSCTANARDKKKNNNSHI